MAHGNREVEIKLEVKGTSNMATVNKHLESLFPDPEDLIVGRSKDVYFETPTKSDFIRVRYSKEGLSQVTVKSQDKGNNVDRVEIDLEVSDPDQAVELLTAALGKPAGTITKRYIVYFLDKRDTTVSLYQIAGDERVFVEVEARSIDKVNKLVEDVKKVLPYDLEQVNKSLFRLFLGDK